MSDLGYIWKCYRIYYLNPLNWCTHAVSSHPRLCRTGDDEHATFIVSFYHLYSNQDLTKIEKNLASEKLVHFYSNKTYCND